mmetsp:Transcript_19054/g.49181  ORF Transcript_19054/g.49181 Transcript_19054/m.49181 type:complete len:80 (+) Transcript_19054:218-457(+)
MNGACPAHAPPRLPCVVHAGPTTRPGHCQTFNHSPTDRFYYAPLRQSHDCHRQPLCCLVNGGRLIVCCQWLPEYIYIIE